VALDQCDDLAFLLAAQQIALPMKGTALSATSAGRLLIGTASTI
jgi:hypothetical protein